MHPGEKRKFGACQVYFLQGYKEIWGMPSLLLTGMDIYWVEMGKKEGTVVQCSGVFWCHLCSQLQIETETFSFWSTQRVYQKPAAVRILR